jgi:hypothetical protein
MLRVTLLFGALLVACGAPARERPPAAVAIPLPERENTGAAEDPALTEQAVLNTLLGLNRALLTHHDIDTYMAGWRNDGVWVGARNARPGKYDVKLDTEQLAALRRLVVKSEPSREVSYDDERVAIDDERATVSWTLRTSFDTTVDLFAEKYELVFERGHWKVVAFRYWPVARTEGNETYQFEAGWADALDAKIEAMILTGGNEAELTYELFNAYRFREAHAVVKRVTEADPDNTWAWRMRMLSAGFSGDIDDATLCQERLEMIDHGSGQL